MAKNRSFTGGRKSVGTPTLGKEAYFQLIKKVRKANERVSRRTHDSGTALADVSEGLGNNVRDSKV